MGTPQHKTDITSAQNAQKKAKSLGAAVGFEQADPLAHLADALTVQRAMADPRSLSPKALPGLQRAVGNQYLQLMLTAAARQQSTNSAAAQVQTQIVRDHQQGRAPATQRQADEGESTQLPDSLSNQINQEISRGGSSLPRETRRKMQQNLGVANPGAIRVHHDTPADALSQSLGAKAFTTGNHIFFQHGEYDPGTAKGQKLLYHEGVHTMQQGGTKQKRPQTKMTVTPPSDKYEQEADEIAEEAMSAPESGQPQFAALGSGSQDDEGGGETDARAAEGATEQATAAPESPELQSTGPNLGAALGVQRDEEGKEKDEPTEEELKKKKEGAKEGSKEKTKKRKEKAKEKGAQKGESKKKETGAVKKVPKPDKPNPPAKMEAKLSLPDVELDPDEFKFDPEAEYEEPEMEEPPLPTWDDLAAGTIQMSPEDVSTELNVRSSLFALGEDGQGFEDLSGDIEVGSESAEGEGAEDVDKGALIGDALAEGALSGLQEGATSFISDQIIEAATSKIPYADGYINMMKLAQDPNQWFEDNVMAVGQGAVDMVKGFSAIGDEDTAWGYMAATLEAIVGVIDFINSIIGLINTIFTIILAISKAMIIIGNAMIALAPVVPFGIMAWTPGVFGPIVYFFGQVIAFLDPVNNTVSAVGNILGAVKYGLQPVIILLRILDIAESKADPEKLKEKQEKLKGTTSAFVQSTTEKVANKAKDKAAAKIQKRYDKYKMKKAENEMEAAGIDPKMVGPLDENQQKIKDKYDKAKEDYQASVEADKATKFSSLLPWKTAKAQFAQIKGETADYDKRDKKKYGDLSPEEYEKKRKKGVREQIKENRAEAKERYAGHLALTSRRPGRDPAKKAKDKSDEYDEAHRQKVLAEDEYERLKETSDDDLGVRWTKMKADESLAALEAAKKRGDPDEIKRAEEEHRRRQEAWYGNYKQQEENEKKTAEAKKRLDDYEAREEQARKAKEAAQKKSDDYQQWKENIKNKTGKEFIKTWQDVGGWNVLSGGDMGGQRHGYGVIGFSGNLFSFIKDQTGWDPLGLFKPFDEFAVALAKADTLLLDYQTTKDSDPVKAAEYAGELPPWLGKIGFNAQQQQAKKAKGLEDRAQWLEDHDHNSQLSSNLRTEAAKIRGHISSAQAVIQIAATYGIQPSHWAEQYGAKVFFLHLKAEGLPPEDDNCERGDSSATVFIVKGAGEKVHPATMYDTEISDTEAEMGLYTGQTYQIESKPVEMKQDGAVVTYEPYQKKVVKDRKITTVTVKYRIQETTPASPSPVQTARDEGSVIQRAPKESLTTTVTPPSLASITIQRAPADEEEKPMEQADLADDEIAALEAEEAEAQEEAREAEAEAREAEAEEAEAQKEAREAEAEFEEEEMEEDEGDIGRAALLTMQFQARLMGELPPPPEGVFGEIQGAALAYNQVDSEEYGLKLQQQDIFGLKQHGEAQLAQVKGTRALTAVNQQGVAAHQADADAKLQAQSEMKQAASAQEAGAQGTADKSSGGAGILGSIFNKILAGFGMGGSGGGADTGAMKDGTEEQSQTTKAASQATKDASKISDQRTAETQKVKAEAAGVQDSLSDFDDMMVGEEQGTSEGLGELDEAADQNEEQVATMQEEKMRLQEKQTEALGEADAWAMEHRQIREDILAELEEALATES
jgi:hypothetical protein